MGPKIIFGLIALFLLLVGLAVNAGAKRLDEIGQDNDEH